jgi:hypothetical protein
VNGVDPVIIEAISYRFSRYIHVGLGQIVYGIGSQSSREEMVVLICRVDI